MEDWKMTTDNKEYVTVLSTDMSKAFDSLHPALMIQKLKAYGFSETSLNLLPSFHERRRNRIKLQEERSAWKEQKRGCRQDSSFGPLLWNLFQNDLSLHRQSADLFMYGDDHQIYTISGNTGWISKFQSSSESLDSVLKSWQFFPMRRQ